MKKENEPKIIAVVQARMGSTRLPKKALLKIKDRTLIGWIKYRLSFCGELDGVILATGDLPANDELEASAKDIGLKCYRGSETDLIKRLLGAAETLSADAIVRITGDCPLVDSSMVDKLAKVFKEHYPEIDYVTNISPPTYPDGMDIEIISTETLRRLDRKIKEPLYREWLTTTILENPKNYKIINVPAEKDMSFLRLTVDYPEDFELAKKIFLKLDKENKTFHLNDILELFQKEPDLVKINGNRVDKKVVNNIRSAEFYKLKSQL